MANGDYLLANFAYKTVLKKLCQKEGIDEANLHLEFSKPDSTYPQNWSDRVRVHSKNILDNKIVTMNFVQTTMTWLGDVLDIQISEDDLNSVPIPEKMNRGALKNFELEEFLKDKQDIDEKRDGNRLRVVIGQSGSVVVKRLSDYDVLYLAEKLKQLPLPIDVWVVSDKKFINTGNINTDVANSYESAVAKGTLKGVTIETNINKIAAGLAGDFLITTDSFYSHLGFGAQKLVNKNTAIIPAVQGAVLYTIEPPEKWLTPGSTPCKSLALNYVIEEKNQELELAATNTGVVQTVGGVLKLQDYYNQYFSNHNNQSSGINIKDIEILTTTASKTLIHTYLRYG
jgi:hypothetical protein